MKIVSAALALMAVVSPASAFVVKTPSQKVSCLKSFSYLSNEGGVPSAMSDQANPTPSAASGKMTSAKTGGDKVSKGDIALDPADEITVQGESLQTWSYSLTDRVQVYLKTEGRPLNANVELWQGPDNTPQKMQVYSEDGDLRPFSAVIETPYLKGDNTIGVYNTAPMEFPLLATCNEAAAADDISGPASMEDVPGEVIQGGALKTYSLSPAVGSVRILLQTSGRPLYAKIELLQGPNNKKQVVDLYTEDGIERPFMMVVDTPGAGNVIRVVNTAPMEFPLTARVEPLLESE